MPSLNFLYTRTSSQSYYNRYNDDTPLDTVIALLLLSTRYDFRDIRKDVVIQLSKQYPLDLQAFDSVDDFFSPLFGWTRWCCHFPLLVAAVKADVDVLLPTLYFPCSELSIDEILDEADSMTQECIHTLIKGRIYSDNGLNALVAGLPDDVMEVVGSGECSRNEPCLRNARYKSLSELANPKFSTIQGSRVVAQHLSPVCANCSSSVTKAIDNKRAQIWANVPSYFGFPGWDALQARLEQITERKLEVNCFRNYLRRSSNFQIESPR